MMTYGIQQSITHSLLQFRFRKPFSILGSRTESFRDRVVTFWLGGAQVVNPNRIARRDGADLLIGRVRFQDTSKKEKANYTGGFWKR